jgi:hypothetical protein
MEVITINDKYTPLQIAYMPSRPNVDDIVHIIDTVTYPDGAVGVLLAEHDNPPVKHSNGLGTYIPTFNIKRFTTLNSDKITKEMIVTTIKVTSYD